MQRMHAFDPALCAVNMQSPMAQIDLSPAQLAQLGSSQPMPICQQDRSSIPWAIPSSLARCLD
jgi:hypothetical protein